MNQNEVNSSPLDSISNADPYQYLQDYIYDMSSQIFLSNTLINNIFRLLRIDQSYPWKNLRVYDGDKKEINALVENKIKDIKFLFRQKSQLLAFKATKRLFNQIEKMMNLLTAKNKSIYIEKQKYDNQISSSSIKTSHQIQVYKNEPKFISNNQNQQPNAPIKSNRNQQQQQQKQYKNHQYVISDLISTLLLNIQTFTQDFDKKLPYNPNQKSFQFQIKSYNVKIKNDDHLSYDLTSKISKIPINLLTEHIFPYLSACELFGIRQVCKQWQEHVRKSWFATYTRESNNRILLDLYYMMIKPYYKLIQKWNPSFRQNTRRLYTMIQTISWQQLNQMIEENTINSSFRSVLLVLLKIMGQNINLSQYHEVSEELWQQNKHLLHGLRNKLLVFLLKNENSISINQLKALKANILEYPFLQEDHRQYETNIPLYIFLFVKRLNLQQILKNNLRFSEQYILKFRRKIKSISSQIQYHKTFIDKTLKILLFKSFNKDDEKNSKNDNFKWMINKNQQPNKPDYEMILKNTRMNIYLSRAAKEEIFAPTTQQKQENKQKIQQNYQDQENNSIIILNKQEKIIFNEETIFN